MEVSEIESGKSMFSLPIHTIVVTMSLYTPQNDLQSFTINGQNRQIDLMRLHIKPFSISFSCITSARLFPSSFI